MIGPALAREWVDAVHVRDVARLCDMVTHLPQFTTIQQTTAIREVSARGEVAFAWGSCGPCRRPSLEKNSRIST